MPQQRMPGRPGAGPRQRSTSATRSGVGRATVTARPGSRPAVRRGAPAGAAKRTSAPQPHQFTGRATALALVLGVLLPVSRFADAGLGVRVAVMAGEYAVVIAAGAACYHLIEEPSRKAIRALITRRSRRAAVSA